MDPHLFSINSANELRLRRHIRDVLLPYARVHLTSDHVAFTEKAVEELLLQTLEYVPMADATSFFLPTDPFELLMRSLDSLDLAPPIERWVTPSAHVRYLRTLFPPLNPHDLPTEKCWHEEDDRYAKLSLICRPVSSPTLSNRARLETPRIGSTNYRASIPCSNSTLTTYLDLDTISIQSIEDSPTPPVDDVLDLRYKLSHATSVYARPLLQSVLVPPIAEKLHCTPNVPEFLNHESPLRYPPRLHSPPLFTRVAPQRCTTHSGVRGDMNSVISNPTRFPELVSVLRGASPELMDSEDGDTNSHHMEVASGRPTLTFSSPPPHSPHSGGSELDELWNIPSPGTPATSLIAAKIDDVEIPRTRKFGHKNTLTDERANHGSVAGLLTMPKSPGFFITSFISAPIPMAQAPISILSQLEGIKSGMHSPHPLSPGRNTSDSLLGQPPSISEELAAEKTSAGANVVEDYGEQLFDDALASIYVSAPKDPLCYIRQEKLEEKDIMLMDVPNLPPPTTHPREPILFPEGMQTFVTPAGKLGRLSNASHGNGVFGLASFLKPVKGIKPLVLDLSWRPFNFGKAIPTDEDVAGVAASIQLEDEVPGYRDEKYEGKIRILLNLGIPSTSAEEAHSTLISYTPRGCDGFGTSPAPKRTGGNDHIEYLLTHRERLLASDASLRDADAHPEVNLDTDRRIASHADGHENIPEGDILHHREQQNPRDSFDLAEYHAENHSHSFGEPRRETVDDTVSQISTDEFSAPRLLHISESLLYDMNSLERNKENIDSESEDKENIPPWDAGDCQLAANRHDPTANQYDWSCCPQLPDSEASPFESLSFTSQNQLLRSSDDLAHSKVQDPPSADRPAKRPGDELGSTEGHEQTNSGSTKRRKLDDLVPASSKDLFSTFITLRKQATSGTIRLSETRNDTPMPYQTPDVPEPTAPRGTPDDLFDQHTVRLPEDWVPAAAVHRYLVSMNVIQKRALVCELQGHRCRVILVERCDLGGTDIIVDPDFGVLLVPLLALPANINSAVERISSESWRYSNLLIIFEAFPSAKSYRADRSQGSRPVPYAYTPPICKAIKKLRRNLGIAEGCGTMNPECKVTWAFANDVQEAARLLRCFGEEVCTISVERGYGLQWDEREWLEEEAREGESMLAAVHGMNAFASFVMLYNRSLDAIVELSPEARLAEFGPLLGKARVIGLNAVIESKLRQIATDITDCVADPGQ